ncbi:MAG: ATP-dependent RNA helicase HrpA [Actinomycetaceae bacterium]|nr:ATP-dependent RNA helicase HrpA [Actinomycetaceae bacterium]
MAGKQKSKYSREQLAGRVAALPVITYPEQLPVSARRDEIANAVENNQVVIVSGETGSGKTTQLPKICLQLGRGIRGMIGHTQPRRLAARTVADRIAEELGTKVGNRPGDVIGFQVRFTDEVGPTTLVKLMTDGILLAEIQNDPNLYKYDTIIIDEAHERSLNIDFLIGYLTRLLPKRPDLKVIITSATIDSQRFANHFAKALGRPVPVVEVSGRTYPVEIRYRPLAQADPPSNIEMEDEDDAPVSVKGLVLEDPDSPLVTLGYGMGEDIDHLTGICEAVDELAAEGPGDILVFLPGERDIRDSASALQDHLGGRYIPAGEANQKSPLDGIEVLPLYSRLSAPEQQRVFRPHPRRRVVLATNVAETSLTVPGIRYVIDPGLARISRYSNRTKVQRLPIEPVSQASANQRSGRSGRVADGIAIRLYSQQDFLNRPKYTEPEILRTSLAAVILQMASLGLGNVEHFPFLDAPAPKAVRDGVNLLEEIGAVRHRKNAKEPLKLTRIGHDLARLPIDPRLGRMLIEGQRGGVASEVLIIVAALSMQDVRERPAEFKEDADRAHDRFLDPESDFITYLSLWRYLRTQSREMSNSAFRRMCRREFLHYLRWREWQDVVGQLQELARPLKLDVHSLELPSRGEIRRQEREGGAVDAVARAVTAFTARTSGRNSEQIHRSLLVGLLSNLGAWDQQKQDYLGARGTHFVVWPGSGLARKHYDWVMAAELVETSRLFARTVAKIKPEWVEPLAKRLVKRVYSEPYWSSKMGAAMVREKVMLYGLTLVADRPVLLGNLPAGVKVDAPQAATSIAARTGAGVTGFAGSTPREVAREMFIQHALVDGDWRSHHRFVKHNAELLDEIHESEKKLRQGGTVSDDAIYAFYDERVPAEVVSARHFDGWWRRQRDKKLLEMSRRDLLPGSGEVDAAGYPSQWRQGDISLPLRYEFDPGSPRDGLTIRVPVAMLTRVRDRGFEWLVPGMLDELVTATIRALPKQVRAQLVPAPDVASDLSAWIRTHIWNVNEGEPDSGAGDSTPSGAGTGGAGAASGDSAGGAGSSAPTAGSSPATSPATSAGVNPEDPQDPQDTQEPEEDEVDPRSLEASLGRLAAWASKSGAADKKTIARMEKAAERKPAKVRAEKAASAGEMRAESPSKIEGPMVPGTRGGEYLPHFFDAFVRAASMVKGVDVPRDLWGELDLPGHATPTFVVVNEQGREVRAAQDLTWLQKQLGAQSRKASRSAMRQALDQALKESGGRRAPDARTLKAFEDVTPGGAGASKAGAPGVSKADAPGAAGAPVDAEEYRAGLARLVLSRTMLPTARVSTRWTGREALVLAAGPYPDTQKLVADAQLAAVDSLLDEYEVPLLEVRSRGVVDELVAWVQDRIEDRTYQILGWTVAAFSEYADLDKRVRSTSSPSMIRLLSDVREHSNSLVYDGFLLDVPFEWLPHVARFVRADAMRVDKASRSADVLARDEGLWRAIKDFEGELAAARERLPLHEVARRRELENAVWLVEELRVSFFAQELGTSQKVSLKRLYTILNA